MRYQGREFLEVQWLGLQGLTAKSPGSIPDWGTKNPHASRFSKTHTHTHTQRIRKRERPMDMPEEIKKQKKKSDRISVS